MGEGLLALKVRPFIYQAYWPMQLQDGSLEQFLNWTEHGQPPCCRLNILVFLTPKLVPGSFLVIHMKKSCCGNSVVFILCVCFSFSFYFVWLSGQGFSVALGPVLELAPVDQIGLEQTEIFVPLQSTTGIKGCGCPDSSILKKACLNI